MKNVMKFISDKIRNIKKEDLKRFAIFIGVVIFTFAVASFLKQHLLIGLIGLVIELACLAIVAWAMAGYVVMKTFFWVGASLSLLIYIAETYCGLPINFRTGDDALKSLLIVGLSYITISFIYNLYKEITNRLKALKEIKGINKNLISWLILIFFALFVGIFVWQIYQVISPIILNLCVY
jgi:hypothetical protein